MVKKSFILLLILFGLHACSLQQKSFDIPPGWSFQKVYQGLMEGSGKYPKLYLPVPLGEAINGQISGISAAPVLVFQLYFENEKKSQDMCSMFETGIVHRKKMNTVEEISLDCPSPIEHYKYLYRASINGEIFFVSPGFLSTEEQRKLIITSLLNAHIDE